MSSVTSPSPPETERLCGSTSFVTATGRSPRRVILSIHPYGKDNLPTRRGTKRTFSMQYRLIRQPRPVTFSTLTGWEAPDPAWWTAHGFVVVNADSRGCGHSDGTGNLLSRQEAEDTYDLVQWIAGQPWSDGSVPTARATSRGLGAENGIKSTQTNAPSATVVDKTG